MAKNDNLSDFMADIADAIRAKKGTSEPINAQDFSAEIASIETGGGGSTVEYWRIDDAEKFKESGIDSILPAWVLSIKYGFPFAAAIVPGGGLTDDSAWEMLLGFSIDRNFKLREANGDIMTVGDFIAMTETDFTTIGCTQITEEEYYNN